MEKEIWKKITLPDLDNHQYEVSNLGNVRNGKTGNVYTGSSVRSGYKSICINGKKAYKIHRLVALTFLENDDPKKIFVNHIDGDKFNNKLSNLEWVTPSANVQHAIDNKLIKITERRVTKIDVETGEDLETYQSLKIASEKTNIGDSDIVRCCKNSKNTAGGFKWKYTDINPNETDEVIDLTDYKQIKDFPNYYLNKEGKLYSVPYKKFLKYQLNNDGYPHVQVTNKGKKKDYLVHRLVAEVFIDNPDNKPQVNHKDMNKNNYHVDNLEWTTGSENMIHRNKFVKETTKVL